MRGIVQGVGFRPFVHGLAHELSLSGSIRNVGGGVRIEIEGPGPAVEAFVRRVRDDAPPLASIDDIDVAPLPPTGATGFAIHHSDAPSATLTPVSPDVATCADCLAEVRDPGNRRHRYPFTNCTNCGPRFTIVRDVPYDRPATTMARFALCADCAREYHDPHDRRFHAQPNACPACGPSLTLVGRDGVPVAHGDAAVVAAQRAIHAGAVVAIKGLGGFHLACDATNEDAVRRLRERKGRGEKPFACMAASLATVGRYAQVSPVDARLLEGRERPIVLLRARDDHGLARSVAPRQSSLGFMLPYTPLHTLLLDAGDTPPGDAAPVAQDADRDVPWVMTSGNRSEEPIARTNDEALERLGDLADVFLMHDRDIHVTCDDSVVRSAGRDAIPLRRSRGYAPFPVRLARAVEPVLAVGGELKATCCVTRDDAAILSQHVGDMANVETLAAFEHIADHLCTLFRVEPRVIVCDMHPGYISRHWAEQRAHRDGLPLVRVQHHHAHAAAVMAEYRLDGDAPVLALTFDGTGYGTDGAIWGGEALLATYDGFERVAHLAPIALPGGDSAIRHPARIALAHLHAAGIPWDDDLAPVQASTAAERRVLAQQCATGFGTVQTTSMGRLFDAVAALLGLCPVASYEGQAAMELEALADDAPATEVSLCFGEGAGTPRRIDPAPLLRAIIDERRRGTPASVLAAAFHDAVAQVSRDLCVSLGREHRVGRVVLSGGVFQNARLLRATTTALDATGFVVMAHRRVPPNDGGLALGQAAIAALGRGHASRT
ncbi:MAG: carbamoyltransferase HypF [Acidobacteria bacterium]|nr:carbamoyltransferase HypF [Acidobacteriota bacterium]